MKSTSLLKVTILLALIQSCVSSDESKRDIVDDLGEFNLILSDTLTIELDSVTPGQTFNLQYFDVDTGNILAYQNNLNNSVILFDLDQKRKIRTLKFQREGPQGIGRLMGFSILNKDTLLTLDFSGERLTFFDLEGQFIAKLKFNLRNADDVVYPLLRANIPVYRQGGDFNLATSAKGNWTEIEDFSQEKISVRVDGTSGDSDILTASFPLDYFEEGITEPVFSRVRVQDQYIYSFYGDPALYCTIDHINLTKKEGKSLLAPESKPGKRNPLMEEYLSWLTESPSYLGLFYDPYRHLIYRFVSLGDDSYDSFELQKTSQFPRNLSLMVFDEDLNLLGESKLPFGKFYWLNSFVTEDGFYVSLNSPFNEFYRSESLNFVKIDFTL